MKEYTTKQRKLLFSFFGENPDRQFTIEELSEKIPDISISAIYRNINQLVEENTIRRFQKNGHRQFFYQYVGGQKCMEHLHLKCNKCGRILHIENESAKIIIHTIKTDFNFDIDKASTILFGSCASCK